jgi:hypothetical protein
MAQSFENGSQSIGLVDGAVVEDENAVVVGIWIHFGNL